MPKQPLFTSLFGRSPISPIQKHMRLVHECASKLIPYIDMVIKEDWSSAEGIANEIFEIEDQADDIKRDIRIKLPKSLFMPVSRADLLELLHTQDRIANISKDITGLILGRKARIPSEISEPLAQFLLRSVQATELAYKALSELDELIDTGFAGRELDLVEDLIKNLDRVEHETDMMQIDIRSEIFKIEKSLDPVDVMFLYKNIEWIGDLADYAQVVGNRMLSLIAR